MNSLARKVYEIPGNPELARQQTRPGKLKVAAYCRVSTDEEEQLTSYEAQKSHYTQRIGRNPDWTLAGIFADEGLTGTSTKHREAFNQMMKLCKQGKIDLILTKSISRFARNTLDSIDHVRKLKVMGIGVYFEKENINTLTMSNEMVFTMLAAFAQAESESISENVRWGKRHAMKQGKVPFQYSRILGYEKGEDGKPQIVPEQAATVRRIFASYLAGYSVPQIRKELEAEGIPAASGECKWSDAALYYMLRNERYIGDALLQKFYVVDCISKQVKKNHGEIAQIYVENNHEGIIPKTIFQRTQEEIARRSSKRRVSDKALTEKGKYSGKYALSELMTCGECGTRYRRVTWARNGKKKVVWRCINRLENGTQYCRHSPTIEESRLHDGILRATNQVLDAREEVLAAVDEALELMTSGGASLFDRLAAQQQLTKLEQNATDIIALTKTDGDSMKYFEDVLAKIYDDRAALLEQIKEDDTRRAKTATSSARLESLMASIRSAPEKIDDYNDAFTREIFEEIRVMDENTLLLTFKGGYEFEIELTQ